MSTTTSPTTRLANLKKHPIYYHASMDLTIIVADICFRQASIFFTRESPVFSERIPEDLTKTDKTKAKGADSDVCAGHTIVIEPHENVSPDDFAELCSVFENPKFSIFDKSLESWKTILRLANKWSFPEVKALAFRELDVTGKFPMSLVDRIVLYQQYSADKAYLEPLYEQLLTRREPLTEKEGEALTLKDALNISAVRQELLLSMLPESARREPFPSKMKDTVLKATHRLLESITSKSDINTQTGAGAAPPGSSTNGVTGAGDGKKDTGKRGSPGR